MENKNKETIQVPIVMFEKALAYLKDYNKKLENFSNELDALVDAHNKGFKKGEENAVNKIYKMAKEYNNGYETDFDKFMTALKEIFNIEEEEEYNNGHEMDFDSFMKMKALKETFNIDAEN